MSNTVYVDGDSLAYPTEGEVGWASPGSQFPTLVQRALDKLGLGQTLNSKAVIDIQSTTKGVLFPRMTTTERDAIGSPPNGLLVFNTTDQQFQYYDTVDVAWIPIGVSSGGTADPNYILFPVALEDPLTTPDYPWRLYNDTTAVPDNGTGGTAAITLVRNTTTPLNPLGDFEVAKAGVSAQGSGFSTDFTIDRRHLGRVLQVSFDAMLKGGTYTAGAIRVYLIQDPTGTPVVIEPVNTTLQLGISDVKVKHIASFQTAIDVTSYRLCIHVYGSDTNSWTISYTNFKVWEPIANYGAIITDWTSYTPTFTALSGSSNVNFKWRRVGGSIQILGFASFTTASGSAQAFTLPSGLTSKTDQASTTIIGTAARGANIANNSGFCLAIDSDNKIYLGGYLGVANNPLTNSAFLGNNESLSIELIVPITGWGSNMALSSDAGDGREIYMIMRGNLNSSINAEYPVTWASTTELIDSHGAFNPSTGIYTAPISGLYSVTGFFNTDLIANSPIRPYINSVLKNILLGISTSVGYINFSGRFYLKAGDQITLRPATTISAVGGGNFLAIERIGSSNQIIAPVETVACSYYSASNQTSLTSQINFGTRVYDTHNAVTTGAGWKFTTPMAGKYRISGIVTSDTGSIYLPLYKNNSIHVGNIGRLDTEGISQLSFEVDLLSGDYIDIRPQSSATIRGGLPTTFNVSHIQISRIGI